MANFKILSQEDISESLKTLPGWSVKNDQRKAEFIFKDFKQAFAFISMIAIESEKMNHHPEWSNMYNKVSFTFSTHDAENKITDLDISMATFISKSADIFQ